MLDTATSTRTCLQIQNLQAWYGESHVLHGLSFHMRQGEVVTLLGRNGAGKTTTLRAIMGLIGKRRGSITVDDSETITDDPEDIARRGVGYCPEERGIYASLTVDENLTLPPVIRPGGLSVAEIFKLFPNLQERRASQGSKLSGGEQQMLAIGRILRTGSKILLLDEPTEGLAPVIVQQIGEVIHLLKRRGFSIVLVEQNFRFAAGVADRHFLVENGRVIRSYTHAEIHEHAGEIRERLGV